RRKFEELSDLRRCQVSAVTERQQFAVALRQLRQRGLEIDPPRGLLLEILWCRRLVAGIRNRARRRRGRQTPAGDPDQPRGRLALVLVVAVLVAQRPLEGLAG